MALFKENQKLIRILNSNITLFSITEESTFTSLLNKIGDSRLVLIGEATHGTKEFYEIRAEITRQLILEKNFMAVAIEADWPSASFINNYLKGAGNKKDVIESLNDFTRFPVWMWRNKIVISFLEWLREYNDNLGLTQKIGLYGLDLYSLYSSIHSVIEYLNKVDPIAAQKTQERYACFDHLNKDPEKYGYFVSKRIKESCVQNVINQILELQYNAFDYIKQSDYLSQEQYFYAEKNAQLIKNAEKYYRAQFEDKESSWNIRDTHMMETLNSLSVHLEKQFNRPSKIIVWAHNSHVGDNRATQMRDYGEINIGQLAREQYNKDAYLIGFSTYQGSVIAASAWNEVFQIKKINPGMPGSYEDLFHHLKHKDFLLHLTNNKEMENYLQEQRLQRAIGVIYKPQTERNSHYFFTKLPYQFDAIIHIDETNPIEPIDLPNVQLKLIS